MVHIFNAFNMCVGTTSTDMWVGGWVGSVGECAVWMGECVVWVGECVCVIMGGV